VGGEVIALPDWICQLPVMDDEALVWVVGEVGTAQPMRKARGNRSAM
jgi:hypothetical protein